MQSVTIENVMSALGMQGNTELQEQIFPYYEDVIDFITSAGVPSSKITVALVARGVSDLWHYGVCDGKLSPYFMQRTTQLSYRG